MMMIGTDLIKKASNCQYQQQGKEFISRIFTLPSYHLPHSFSNSPQLIIFLLSYNPKAPLFAPTMKPQKPNTSNLNPNTNLQLRSPQNKPIATAFNPTSKHQQSSTTQDREDIQSIAMNLSASIFMNSTTKFMKGLPGMNASTASQSSKQKKQLSPISTPIIYISTLRNFSPDKLSATARNASNSKEERPREAIVYPSKEKIQTIVNGKSNQYIKQSQANSDLKKVLNRNRSNSSRNGRNASSSFSQSRSGSVSRLSRKKRVRELKFIEKKERSETSINQEGKKLTDSMMPSKNDTKIKVKAGPMKMATESQITIQATYKISPKAQTQLSNVKSLKNIHEIKSADNKNKNTDKGNKIEEKKGISSIISDISPKDTSKISGYKMNALLPSGELPIDTPVKPMKAQKKGSRETEVSLIVEENSSQINSTKYKGKKTNNHGSSKEESSTFIEFNPTQVVNAARGKPNQNSNISKFAKNQSTKAIGREEQQWGISTIIRMQQQGSNNESKANVVSVYEPKKPPALTETVKDVHITVKPIANSLSFFDVSSPKKSSIPLKKTQRQPLTIGQFPHKSSFLHRILERLYGKQMKNSLLQIKQRANSQANHIKKAQIFLSSLTNTYKNLSLTNERMCFQRLKKIALSNFTHSQSSAKATDPHNVLGNLLYRISRGKISQYFLELKMKSFANTPYKIMISLKDPSKTTIISKDEQNKLYLLAQLSKIQENIARNILRKGFAKLALKAISQPLSLKTRELQAIKNLPKCPKSPRNYEPDIQKLARNHELLSSQIYKLQVKVADKKRSINMQKSKLQRKQDDLSKLNKKIQQQVKQTRQKNDYLKNNLDLINPQQQFDISLPQYEPLIGLLTELYSTVFQTNEVLFNPTSLISKYSLSIQDQNPLLENWEGLSLNTSLKSELSRWQGKAKLSHPKQILLQQQQLISKVLRSYIRERYLWQRLKVSTSQL